jgi:peptidoglycan hydrolase-like protein with peptidoglycan-binding domain
MGARTRQAIIRFQKNAGLNATGQVSQELLDRLQAARG